jgi:hypothetical protein
MNIKLPEGWTAEELENWNCILIRSPERYMVTLDLKRRGFRSGLVTQGRLTSEGQTFRGRGWKQKLADAAVQWLIKEVIS